MSSLVPPLCLLQDAAMKVTLLTVVKLSKDNSLAYSCGSKGDLAPCLLNKGTINTRPPCSPKTFLKPHSTPQSTARQEPLPDLGTSTLCLSDSAHK